MARLIRIMFLVKSSICSISPLSALSLPARKEYSFKLIGFSLDFLSQYKAQMTTGLNYWWSSVTSDSNLMLNPALSKMLLIAPFVLTLWHLLMKDFSLDSRTLSKTKMNAVEDILLDLLSSSFLRCYWAFCRKLPRASSSRYPITQLRNIPSYWVYHW